MENENQNTEFKVPRELFAHLLSMQKEDNKELDTTNYRYVIYARKSTEGEERQMRSLGDQVAECNDLAERLKIQVHKDDIIYESESAKEPDIRPKFRKMLENMKAGKIDGIITWHPDRLARNMKDAGEIIDLLDKKIIKDLKFVTASFENNAMGKMLLGMAFVLSKQYSDNLSDNIRRGNKRSVGDGKWLKVTKHGYYKDRNQLLRPDGNNFVLIKTAFQKRLQGESLEIIAEFLNKSNYSKDGKPYTMRAKRLSEIVTDAVYIGIMRHGKDLVLLQDVYDFVPVISEEDFLKINKLKDLKTYYRLSKASRRDGVKADLMRGMVICGECEKTLLASITPKKSINGIKNYFYYRCDTPNCPRKNKSVRAKVVIDFVVDYLNGKSLSFDEVYASYTKEMIKSQTQKEIELMALLNGLKQKKGAQQRKIEQTKSLLLRSMEDKDISIANTFKKDLKNDQNYLRQINGYIDEAEQNIEKNKNTILTYEKFIELFKELANFTKKARKLEDLDYIIKKVFLNFTIKDNKVANFNLNEPFDRLIKSEEILEGGDEGS